MSKAERGILTSFVFVAGAIFMNASAMHIIERFFAFKLLCGLGCAMSCLSGDGGYFHSENNPEASKDSVILAIARAYALVLSAPKIPSVTRFQFPRRGQWAERHSFWALSHRCNWFDCPSIPGHSSGTQGLTTFGANTFSMAISGPLFTFGIY